jgi:hypothetical protein
MTPVTSARVSKLGIDTLPPAARSIATNRESRIVNPESEHGGLA